MVLHIEIRAASKPAARSPQREHVGGSRHGCTNGATARRRLGVALFPCLRAAQQCAGALFEPTIAAAPGTAIEGARPRKCQNAVLLGVF